MTTEQEALVRNGGSRPVPDPTYLTDEAIRKAIDALTDHVEGRFDVLTERLNGIDKATELRLTNIHESAGQVDEKVRNLKELHDERFKSVAQQFSERDTRSEREARDNKVAVDAAFAAQKEAATKQDEANQKAIDKSEKTTTETIAKLGDLVDTNIKALSDKIDDLKDRLGDVSKMANGTIQKSVGAHDQSDNTRLWVVAIFGSIAAIAAVIFGVLAAVHA